MKPTARLFQALAWSSDVHRTPVMTPARSLLDARPFPPSGRVCSADPGCRVGPEAAPVRDPSVESRS